MKVKIALCQMKILKAKEANLEQAYSYIKEAAQAGAQIIALPEMFNTPYNQKFFKDYSETLQQGETIKMLSTAAKEFGIYIIGGSIPELKEEKVYNTSFVFGREGELLGCHRKMHLFDIQIKNKITFKESEVFSSGDEITIVKTEFGDIGIAICYDIRFPELFRLMSLKGAKIIFVPAAFNMTTGPDHWELSFRCRALDNQLFICGISPARDENFSYVTYGNSIITDPWGQVISKLDEKEGILISEIDMDRIDEVREGLPLLKHRRNDLYQLLPADKD